MVVIEADDRKAMELALIENLQRADLNPIEEAEGYQQLISQYGMTQEQAAERVGKSRPTVANALRLLSLGPEILKLVEAGTISAGHARALLVLKTDGERMAVAQKVQNLSLSVRQTEALCKKMAKPPKEAPKEASVAVDYVAECEKELKRTLGRGVRIVDGKVQGAHRAGILRTGRFTAALRGFAEPVRKGVTSWMRTRTCSRPNSRTSSPRR